VFGIIWYVVFLLPTLFLADNDRIFYSYNHRLYLPFIGLMLAVVEIFRLRNVSSKYKSVIVVFLLGFCLISFTYSTTFKNRFEFFESAIRSSPNSGKALEKLGSFYFADKKCDKALELFMKAVNVNPANHGYYGWVANTYYNCYNNIPMAVEWYMKALKVDSTNSVAANSAISLGNIYSGVFKNDSLAIYWFKKAASIDPSVSYPLYTLGNMLFSTQPDSARIWFEKSIKADPNSSVGWNGLGLVDYQNEKYHDAITDFHNALAINPSETELYKNLMLSYLQVNDPAMVKKYADEYASRGGTLPDEVLEYLNKSGK
jgi:tetratricopeptide (TPR) repeat protein